MQISEDLVQYVIREVMKRLRADTQTTKPKAGLPLLHLVGKFSDLSTPALTRLQKNYKLYEHLNWEEVLPPEASVLITKLNIQALVRVAEGDEGCTVEGRALLAALLNGQPVAALAEGVCWRGYMKTAPAELVNRYRHCEKILMGYGLKLVDEMEAGQVLLGSSCGKATSNSLGLTTSDPRTKPDSRSGRRILSEAELIALCPSGGGMGQSLHLAPGDIMTPLARDYALALKINIIKG